MTENILYTGIGAKKSGKHTKDEFLKIIKSEPDLLRTGICQKDKINKQKVYDKCINKYTKLGKIKECNPEKYYKKHDDCIDKNFKNLYHLKANNNKNYMITTENDKNSIAYKEYEKKCGKLMYKAAKDIYNCNIRYYKSPKVVECKELKNKTTAKCSLKQVMDYVGAEKIKKNKK
jgi:hypothetical protein